MRELIVHHVYELRHKSGVTQEALAKAVGVTRQTIIAIEKGNYIPSVLLALKIAKFFSDKGGSASGEKKRMPLEDIFQIKYER